MHETRQRSKTREKRWEGGRARGGTKGTGWREDRKRKEAAGGQYGTEGDAQEGEGDDKEASKVEGQVEKGRGKRREREDSGKLAREAGRQREAGFKQATGGRVKAKKGHEGREAEEGDKTGQEGRGKGKMCRYGSGRQRGRGKK